MKRNSIHTNRRSFLAGAVAGGVFTFMPAGARAQDNSFTVMAVGGTWGEAIQKHICEPFAQAHGLSITYDSRPNAQQIAMLQASRGRPVVNTLELGGPTLGQAMLLDLVDKIDPALVPNFSRVIPSLRNDFWAPRCISPWVLTYDPDVFSAEEVQERGWSILTDERVRGRVALPDFGWMGEMWLHSVNLALGGSYDNTDAAFELAAKIVKENDGIVMGSNDQGMNLFSTGEIVAAPFWSGRTLELKRQGVKVEYAFAPGWSPTGFGFGVVSGNSNPEMAQRFVDFSLSDDVQLIFARQFSYPPTLQDIVIPDDIPDVKISQDAFDAASVVDFHQASRFTDANLERWNEEVIG